MEPMGTTQSAKLGILLTEELQMLGNYQMLLPTFAIEVVATATSASGSEVPKERASKDRWEKLVLKASRRDTRNPRS